MESESAAGYNLRRLGETQRTKQLEKEKRLQEEIKNETIQSESNKLQFNWSPETEIGVESRIAFEKDDLICPYGVRLSLYFKIFLFCAYRFPLIKVKRCI